MYCGKCGVKLPDASRFCPNCGESTGDVPTPSETRLPQAAPNFWNGVKANLSKPKIAILVLNAVTLLMMFLMPYYSIRVRDKVYPIRFIISNEYPKECSFGSAPDVELSLLMFLFIGGIALIVYSLLVNKYKFCKSSAIGNLIVSSLAFIYVVQYVTRCGDENVKLNPSGMIIHLILSVATLVMVIKMIKTETASPSETPR